MNDFHPIAESCAGVYLDGSQAFIARVNYLKSTPYIEQLVQVDLSSLSSSLKKLPSDCLISCAMPGSSCLIRQLTVKLSKKQAIEAAYRFQVEPFLPYPLEDALMDWSIVSQTEENSTLAIHSTKKESAKKFLDTLTELSLDPEVLSTVPQGIASFAGTFLDNPTEAAIILHLGQSSTHLVLCVNKQALAHHEIPLGFSQINPENNSSKEHKAWSSEVLQAYYSLRNHAFAKNKLSIYLFGAEKQTSAVSQNLKTILNTEILIPKFEQIPDNAAQFAPSIGVALCSLPLEQPKLNLRQEEQAFTSPYRRTGRGLIPVLFSCAALLIASLLYYTQQQQSSTRDLQFEYANLLSAAQLNHKELEQKLFPKEDPLPIENLSPEEIHLRVEKIKKETTSTGTEIPLLPQFPLVSDVLAWLASAEQGSSPSSPLINICHFNYQIVRSPSKQRPKDHYQIRIDLEFQADSTKNAREFHEFLLQSNPFIDNKQEIKWSSNRGKYQSSFYLQDRTWYPTS